LFQASSYIPVDKEVGRGQTIFTAGIPRKNTVMNNWDNWLRKPSPTGTI